MIMAKKGGLGLGLDALFGDNTNTGGDITSLRISLIEPNKNQPRRRFDEAAMKTLADSVAEHGVLQPILVKPIENDRYAIVAGERRFRAAKMAGLSEIPAVVKELTDRESAEAALIENLQREGLNPIEEAAGIKTLMTEYGLTQETAAKALGKSRPALANSLRLLELPEDVKELLIGGKISPGIGKALAGCEAAVAADIASRAAANEMTVRQVEAEIKRLGSNEPTPDIPADPETRRAKNYIIETQLGLIETLGRKIAITSKDGKKGKISIEFDSEADLKKIAEILEGLKSED
jgi:ParB family chromosome partitioning protein